jgi:hypothetical protein
MFQIMAQRHLFGTTAKQPQVLASAPRQLHLRCSTSCIHAVVLAPLTYIIHMDVVNADIAGANICPCRQRNIKINSVNM